MKALILTKGSYPNSDAASARLHFLAQMLHKNKYDVQVFSYCKTETEGVNRGIHFCSLRGKKGSKPKLAYDYWIKNSFIIRKWIVAHKPNVVFVVSCPTLLMHWLNKNQDKLSYKLVHDSVEWYSKEEFKHPFMSYTYLKKEFWMRSGLLRNVRVVAISRFLENYFLSKGNPCIRIPSVCDIQETKLEKKTSKPKLTIAYAGTPGNKDQFAGIIRALARLTSQEKQRLCLRIIGATASQIALNANVTVEYLQELSDVIEFVGRIPHEEVYDELKRADFTILVRPQELRYAKAGFPTKVPESMIAGTPVLTNLTSDLSMYLEDGENSIVVEGTDEYAIYHAFQRALQLTEAEKNKMNAAARRTAEKNFYYLLYSGAFSQFVNTNSDAKPLTKTTA